MCSKEGELRRKIEEEKEMIEMLKRELQEVRKDLLEILELEEEAKMCTKKTA
ncbi:MAG: hypothetical protein F7B11_04905 [Caldisphaeraceae archaeon]|nr:hypothetical protein [Caldisphaeraceae archaeon]MEB2793546.1 hypothetical protein [Caldisphaeraceae archaeon]MEB3692663.1 hypothetical protein [Caldisphaeraceae archaeon]MEB3797670.1 hypothetical protein [Caldisphaeraceae archaeon]